LEAFQDYEPDDAALDVLKKMCRGMMAACPPTGSSCVIMSALLANCLESELKTTIPAVAGALKLHGGYMYGIDRNIDGKHIFSESSDSWDGHCWIIFGKYIVDITLGRTARKGDCRPVLAKAIVSTFGEQVGLIALTEKGARDVGLNYFPRYVLKPNQVLALAGGAIQQFGL
jgi:hypothetical protein